MEKQWGLTTLLLRVTPSTPIVFPILSRRFVELDYDSDSEDDPQAAAGQQQAPEEKLFTIYVDASLGDIRNLVQEGDDCLGMHRLNTNKVYVAAGSNTPSKTRGTLCHEICHFVADEVFKNITNPYSASDKANQNLFKAITEDLKARKTQLHPTLQNAFDYYLEEYYDRELIVRVCQVLVEEAEGLSILQTQAPALLEYYCTVFLDAVTKHTDYLLKSANALWPQEAFQSVLTHRLSISS